MAEMLQVIAGRSKVMLRVTFSKAANAASLLDLPIEPMTICGDDPQAAWLAPHQWLLTSDQKSAEELVRRCNCTLANLLHSATDASAAMAAFRLEHPRGRTLLAMGCGLDFDRLVLGKCARTRMARIPVVVIPLANSYELYVDRSFSRYLECWVSTASRDPLLAESCPVK